MRKVLYKLIYNYLNNYKEVHCGLYTKWDKEGNFVSIDSGHNGERRMYIIDVLSITNHG